MIDGFPNQPAVRVLIDAVHFVHHILPVSAEIRMEASA
jgi:hypothetical protein